MPNPCRATSQKPPDSQADCSFIGPGHTHHTPSRRGINRKLVRNIPYWTAGGRPIDPVQVNVTRCGLGEPADHPVAANHAETAPGASGLCRAGDPDMAGRRGWRRGRLGLRGLDVPAGIRPPRPAGAFLADGHEPTFFPGLGPIGPRGDRRHMPGPPPRPLSVLRRRLPRTGDRLQAAFGRTTAATARRRPMHRLRRMLLRLSGECDCAGRGPHRCLSRCCTSPPRW